MLKRIKSEEPVEKTRHENEISVNFLASLDEINISSRIIIIISHHISGGIMYAKVDVQCSTEVIAIRKRLRSLK
jgi:hypothetical protein